MKIAIYHNLEKGGALNEAIEIIKILNKKNRIDLYTFKNNIDEKLFCNKFIFHLKETENIFQHLKQIFFEKKNLDQKIAKKIIENKYDLVLIFPCILTQSPHVLRYLDYKKNVNIYFFAEPKREFYEKTSFDYFNIKKIVTRIIRIGIKYLDIKNCKKTKNIITNSYYSSNICKKIYNQNSFVIYPGLKEIPNKKINIINNKKILSVGLHSYIKGHDFSIKQLNGIHIPFDLIGRKTNETKEFQNIATKNNVNINYIFTENDKEKYRIYKNHSIFLSNSRKEPFGITTIEAVQSNCYVLGINYGGTPEIIENGKNGFLYPDNLKIAQTILRKNIKYNKITIVNNKIIDWQHTANNLINLYHYLKHQPNE